MKDEIKKEREAKKQKDELDQKYASKNDISQLTDAITQIAKTVNELAQKQANPIIVEKQTQEIAGTADMSKIKESEMPPINAGIPTPTTENITGKIEEGGVEKMPIPPAWRKMVDEILGLDFGIDIVYPQSGSGFLFKIIVPAEKSNASESYKEFYKVDIRTKAISYSEGIEGVKKFCEMVKINLAKK